MGYDVHITRAARWTESEATPITLEEWLRCVESDPDMRLERVAEATTPAGDTLRYENDGLAVWTAYSGAAHGQTPWFDHRRGRISVKNPDEEVRRKMCAIAQQLGARVEGDDGETYDANGNATPEAESPGDAPASRESGGRVGGWLLRLFGRRNASPPPPARAAVDSPFRIGQRVRDYLGKEGTVIALDGDIVYVQMDGGGKALHSATPSATGFRSIEPVG